MSKIKFYDDSAKTNQVYPELDPEEMAQKANIDGYYEEMAVGVADNLSSRGDGVPASFYYRTAGGDEDIADGTATITNIKGNTLFWNQLINRTSNTSKLGLETTSLNGVITINGTSTGSGTIALAEFNSSFYNKIPATGKILFKFNVITDLPDGVGFGLDPYTPNGWTALTDNSYPSKYAKIGTANNHTRIFMYMTFPAGVTFNDYKIIPQMFNLTMMFGKDNEPTFENFNKLFPLNYYQYNEYSLLNFNGTDLKTVGFNQWDEDWEVGRLDVYTGANYSSTTQIRSKNYISVFPNTVYNFKMPMLSSGEGAWIAFYDENKNIIPGYYYGTNMRAGNMLLCDPYGGRYTIGTPSNAVYMRFYMTNSYGNVYNNDICVNLSWSGYRNGEYEPYWDYERNLPISEYFPDGMKSIKDATSSTIIYDEMDANKAIIRLKSIKLKDVDWSTYTISGTQIFYGTLPSDAPTLSEGICINGFSTLYQRLSTQNWQNVVANDKTIAFKNVYFGNRAFIMVRDDSCSTIEDFTTKIATDNGFVIYSLKDSIETKFETPINLSYKVSDFGTEQILPEHTSNPEISPFNGTILYGMNAVDTLRRLPENYVSKDSMNNFLGTLGESTQSTWSATYNDETAQYDYNTDLDLTQKANIDGYYEEMTVGAADNLTGKGSGVPATFTKRTSGGNEDISDGVATIKDIKGRTLYWNNFYAGGNLTAPGDGWYQTPNVGDYQRVVVCTRIQSPWGGFGGKLAHQIPSGHKIYVSLDVGDVVVTGTNNLGLSLLLTASGHSNYKTVVLPHTYNDGDLEHNRTSVVFDATYGGSFNIYGNMRQDRGTYMEVKNMLYVDLTLMFGKGLEPATAEEFESMFDVFDYTPNTSYTINYTGNKIKTIGFNAFDNSKGYAEIVKYTNDNNGYQITGNYQSIGWTKDLKEVKTYGNNSVGDFVLYNNSYYEYMAEIPEYSNKVYYSFGNIFSYNNTIYKCVDLIPRYDTGATYDLKLPIGTIFYCSTGSESYYEVLALTPDYDNTQTYNVDDIVFVANSYKKCTTAITTPEEYNSSHWGNATLQNMISAGYFSTALSNVTPNTISNHLEVISEINPSTLYPYWLNRTLTVTTENGVSSIQPPDNGYVYINGGDNTTCLHLIWSGYRNGETEEHWDYEKELPVAQYFPNGMRGVEGIRYSTKYEIYDEITNDKAIQRLTTWTINGTETWYIRTNADNVKQVFTRNVPSNVKNNYSTPAFCPGYIWSGIMYNYGHSGEFGAGDGLAFSVDDNETVDTWKAKLQANPLTITIPLKEYIETPLDEDTNLGYKVSDFGIEEILPKNTSSIITTSPFNGNIVYGINAADTIRRLPENYMSEESMEAFLSVLNTATNGTWTMTYNSTTGKYGFTFTPNQESGGN